MTLRGRVLYVDREVIWLARRGKLFASRDGGESWVQEGRLLVGPAGRLCNATRLGQRLTRAGVHHLLPGIRLAFAHRQIFRRDAGSKDFHPVAEIRGSRPLVVATDGELVCYGEYRKNPGRAPISVWGSRDRGDTWLPLHEFRRVRHVHGVHYDPHTGAFWITTGDEDDESGLWATFDRFETVEFVVGGSQQTRAVQLLFTEEHVYFGSDTPRAPNYLYRLDRGTGELQELQQVGSSVFYGCRVGGHMFFSTAADPSFVNPTDRVEIWHSANGVDWHLVRELPADRWSSRLFQYGQVLFPAGPGDGENLYYSLRGTPGDGTTVVRPLSDPPGARIPAS